MTSKTQSRSAGLSLSILAALSIAACSGDKTSPTGASSFEFAELQPASHVTNVDPEPAPQGFDNVTSSGLLECSGFDDVNLRVFARGTDVVVQYAIDGVPQDGYYWIRFWPNGRHQEKIDHHIGNLKKGESASGEYVVMSFDGITEKVKLNYNVDVDVADSEELYRQGETVDQCDRGGELCIEPPPPPPVCGPRVLELPKMKLTRINYGNVRITAYASARNFSGTVELEWQNMGHRDIVARGSLARDANTQSPECAMRSTELSWETDRSWARHATFIVRIKNDKGKVVKSKTCTVGDLKNGQPDTWKLSCS